MAEQDRIPPGEEIYRDLSPIVSAADQLAQKLPEDRLTLDDEAFHFFYFQTNDRAAVKRTIKLACEQRGWEHFAVPSMSVFVQDLFPSGSGKAGSEPESKSKKKAKTSDPSAQEIWDAIRHLPRIQANERLFVCLEDPSSEKKTSVPLQDTIIDAFLHRCAERRSEEIETQIASGQASDPLEEVRVCNRLFFVLYGPEYHLREELKTALCTITYPSLAPQDFQPLLWEYHLRQQRLLSSKPGNETRGIDPLNLSGELLGWYANSMAGLEEIEVRRLLASMDRKSFPKSGYVVDYTQTDVVDKAIIAYKTGILQRHNRLQIVTLDHSEQIAGLETISNWLTNHREAVRSYTDPLSGILLVGLPGTGKSLTAKAAAHTFGLKLVRLDMSRILGGRVGDSEKGMRETLEDLKFVAPCVLWIDEVEKAMSGASGKSGDGGTVQRLFGMLLTFIQENDRPVFLVTTANDISHLPPEFFRSGRFDQAFCLMMPSYEECKKIMALKLERFEKAFGWKFHDGEAGALLDQCLGTPSSPRFLTGADIEAHVQELFWRYRQKQYNAKPKEEELLKDMREIAGELRPYASPDAPHTMAAVAECYLDMMQRGMTMGGDKRPEYTQDKLRLRHLRFYSFHEDRPDPHIPLCLEEPKAYQNFRDPAKITGSPRDWYDARFFYELSQAMSTVVFMDREKTMEQTRGEYWKLMARLEREKKL